MTVLMHIEDLTLRTASRTLLTALRVDITSGERWGLLGKNGAGKTTLLHTLANLRLPAEGHITIQGSDLSKLKQREIAQRIGLLFQDQIDALPASVLETALLGRHPHARGRLFDNEADLVSARESLSRLGLLELETREVSSLSGGERQRLALATLLAQKPNLLLLDEPSNHLDLGFQTNLIELLRREVSSEEAAAQDRALVVATHDINLAARLCNKIILLDGKGNARVGATHEVLTRENLSAAYDCDIAKIESEDRTLFYPH